MPKGYSKEIMEALFKEEQAEKEKQAAEAKKEAEKKEQIKKIQLEAYIQEAQQLTRENDEKRIADLEKKVNRLTVALVIVGVIALVATAGVFSESLKEFMLLLP